MEFSRKIIIVVIFFLALIVMAGFYFTIGNIEIPIGSKSESFANKKEGENLSLEQNNISNELPLPSEELQKPLENPPPIIKAVYVTSGSAASKKYLLYLDNLFATTQINAAVIDIKTFSGSVAYNTNAAKVREYENFAVWFDVSQLIEHLHSRGIYVIARLNVFNDSELAKDRPDLAIYDKSKTIDNANPVLWQENFGQYWLDPASEEVWDYNIDLSKDVLLHGFDEVNFDYIRFPSSGDLENAGFPKWDQTVLRRQIIKNFFKKIRESIPDGKISVDLFGQTTVIMSNDMGIGQVFEDAFEYFDYISPMVYPSHYVRGFLGYETPSEYPYEVVKNAMDIAKARLSSYEATVADSGTFKKAKIRPWLQDFTLTVKYDANKVKKEIQAVEDSLGQDFNGFMLWNPSNFYTIEPITKTLPN